MKSPSFQARFAAILGLLAIINYSLMSGPPGGMTGTFGGTGAQQSSSRPGLESNTGNLSTLHKVADIPTVPGGTFYSYSQIETLGSLAAYTPPVSPMYMSMVSVSGGAGPGAIKIVYATPNTACFGVSASTQGGVIGVYGSSKYEVYPVSWQMNGTNIPAGTFASIGAYVFAILTCQTIAPAGHPDISAYRAVATYNAIASATTTAVTVTFDAQP